MIKNRKLVLEDGIPDEILTTGGSVELVKDTAERVIDCAKQILAGLVGTSRSQVA